MSTKITTASVRVMLSYNFSNFEVAMNLENENGVSTEDIQNARSQCQLLASQAVSEYKLSPNMNLKDELKKVDQKVSAIKDMVRNQEVSEKFEETINPVEAEKVEKLPLWSPKPKEKQEEKPRFKKDERVKRAYNKKVKND